MIIKIYNFFVAFFPSQSFILDFETVKLVILPFEDPHNACACDSAGLFDTNDN